MTQNRKPKLAVARGLSTKLASLMLIALVAVAAIGTDLGLFADTTYTITTTLDAYVSSNLTLSETVGEGGGKIFVFTPTTDRLVSGITITSDTNTTINLTPASGDVSVGDGFRAQTAVAPNSAVTLTLTGVKSNLTVAVTTKQRPIDSHTVTIQGTPYITYNGAGVQTVSHNGNKEYLFSPHYTKRIERFDIYNGISTSAVYVDGGLYSPDGVYSASALSKVDGTVELELTNITKSLVITPILVDRDYPYPLQPSYPNTDSNTSSVTDKTSHTITKVQTLPYNRKIAEVTVRAISSQYVIDTISLRDGSGETTTIYRNDGEFYFGGDRQEIKWGTTDGKEYARFEIEYEKWLTINSKAVKDIDYTHSPSLNNHFYKMTKHEHNGTKIHFSDRSPIRANEMTGIKVHAKNKDSIISEVRVRVGKESFVIGRGDEYFYLADVKYPVVWTTEKGVETLQTALRAHGAIEVSSYGDSANNKPSLDAISHTDKGNTNKKPPRLHAYINGRSNTVFAPLSNVTRAEAIKMLNKAFIPQLKNLNGYSSLEQFKDVPLHFWGAGDINYAMTQGYANVLPRLYSNKHKIATTRTLDESIRTSDTIEVFKPNAAITRAEFISLLLTYAKESIGSYSVDDMMYYDIPREHWAYNYIVEGTKRGIIEGYGGYFNPSKPILRAEAVAMINRAIDRPVRGLKGMYKMNFVDVVTSDWWYEDVLSAITNLKK